MNINELGVVFVLKTIIIFCWKLYTSTRLKVGYSGRIYCKRLISLTPNLEFNILNVLPKNVQTIDVIVKKGLSRQ